MDISDASAAMLQAARKRPELIGLNSQFSAGTPQYFATVDRDKTLKQGVVLSDVYEALQASLGGLYVNQFNRFGRQWKVFLEAESENRATTSAVDQYYVRNHAGAMVPLSTLVSMRPGSGPDFTNRFNLYRAAQVLGGLLIFVAVLTALTILIPVLIRSDRSMIGFPFRRVSRCRRLHCACRGWLPRKADSSHRPTTAR